MTRVLLIDASLRGHLLTALVAEEDGRWTAEALRLEPARVDAALPERLRQLDIRRLSAVAVTTGPGSSTGVRIGAAAALGLAAVLDISVHGFGSLELVACGIPARIAAWAAAEAGRGGAFVARVAAGDGVPRVTGGWQRVGVDEWLPPPAEPAFGLLPGPAWTALDGDALRRAAIDGTRLAIGRAPLDVAAAGMVTGAGAAAEPTL